MDNGIRYSNILIAAPPFYSHFRPLRSLGCALANLGARVSIASDESFRDDVLRSGLEFRVLSLNRNANIGNARLTKQAVEEQQRLEEFLKSTSLGALETLLTQAGHRRADMLPDPDGLADDIAGISDELKPDLWIVDQLSYGATLALTGMKEPFVTFCAPHPTAIPGEGELYGVPAHWPDGFHVDESLVNSLKSASLENDRLFTGEFNRILAGRFNAAPVLSAFRHASKLAIIYNYPDLNNPRGHRAVPVQLYSGHSFEVQELPENWRDWCEMDGPSAIIAFGTFLSSRTDVIRRLIVNLREIHPDIRLAVGAGDGVKRLSDLADPRIRIESFIPQRALLSRVGFAVHHGGVSSFTEALYAGRPSVVMPFSSDQFDVARDVQSSGLGTVLNPNTFTSGDLMNALTTVNSKLVGESVAGMSKTVRQRGPDWTARSLILNSKEAL